MGPFPQLLLRPGSDNFDMFLRLRATRDKAASSHLLISTLVFAQLDIPVDHLAKSALNYKASLILSFFVFATACSYMLLSPLLIKLSDAMDQD